MRVESFRLRLIASAFLALAFLGARAPMFAQERANGLIGMMGIPSEIAPVEARIEGAKVTRIQGVVFTSGTIDGSRIVAARSGAGKVNAAIAATLLVDHFSPSAVVFT